MMASTKRENPSITEEQEQSQLKKFKNYCDPHDFSSNTHQNLRVVLNPADCDLAFNIEGDGLTGHALYEQGFAYCWSGARANVGITGGKYCFGCKIISGQRVEMEDTPADEQNLCRIGISRGDDPVGNLGETEHSFGFGGTGKISDSGRFLDYGEKFGIGDIIICLVDLESEPWGSIEFCKNGRRLGIAKHVDLGHKGLGLTSSAVQKLPWESAIFPHVLLKNTVVEMQFNTEDGLVPVEGYKPWASALKEEKAIIGPSLAEQSDCEVIMMVGLPASGKSTWAENWVKKHPEKRYVLLGTNLALEQMKVPGLLRKRNYSERFDQLMDRATRIFNTLLSRASKVPRNYILDQTNVYKNARKRKLKPFAFFHKIAVVVFPRAEELKLRAEKRYKEMGKEVPPEAVNEMLGNFSLPMSKDMRGADEYFNEIIFTELNRFEAEQQLQQMQRALSSRETAESDRSTREPSVQSEFGQSAYVLPSLPHAPLGYSGPSMGVGGPVGPLIRHPELANMTHPTDVDTRYTGHTQPSTLEGVRLDQTNVYESIPSSYHGNLNPVAPRDAYQGGYPSHYNPAPREEFIRHPGGYPSHCNPAPREEFIRHPGHMHDPYGRLEAGRTYGPPTGYMGIPDGAGTAYQLSYGPPPVAAPNSIPHGQLTANPEGHPNPVTYGTYPASAQHPGAGARPYCPPTYGIYPANAQHPGAGATPYGPPRDN